MMKCLMMFYKTTSVVDDSSSDECSAMDIL